MGGDEKASEDNSKEFGQIECYDYFKKNIQKDKPLVWIALQWKC